MDNAVHRKIWLDMITQFAVYRNVRELIGMEAITLKLGRLGGIPRRFTT